MHDDGGIGERAPDMLSTTTKMAISAPCVHQSLTALNTWWYSRQAIYEELQRCKAH